MDMMVLAALLLMADKPAFAEDPFLWGVANSSFQTEGAANDANAPAHSNWYQWEHIPGRIKDGSTADVATDFWDLYDTDFALAQELGASAFRTSLAWERIEPARGQFDEAAFEHYETVLVAMRARGLEPIVTLMHSAMPMWIAEAGGVRAKTFPDDFAEYAETAVRRLAGPPANVRYWMTLNEPATMAEGKYIDGDDPSDTFDKQGNPLSVKGDGLKFLEGLTGQVEAHLAAAAKIRALGIEGLKLGVASDWTVIQTGDHDPLSALVAFFARRVYDQFFLDGIVKGKNSLCLLGPLFCPAFKHVHDGKLPSIDYVGLNYYTREIVKGVDIGNGPDPVSESGSDIYPQGMELSLEALWKAYQLPILVSENGVADSKDPGDEQRIQFLQNHTAYLQKARLQDKIPVLGYLYWSLTDNFEWSDGYTQHYGLCSVDPTTLARVKRPSFDAYAQIIAGSSVR